MKPFLRQYEVTSFDGKESWRELMEEKLRDKPNFYPVFFQKIIRLDPVGIFISSQQSLFMTVNSKLFCGWGLLVIYAIPSIL